MHLRYRIVTVGGAWLCAPQKDTQLGSEHLLDELEHRKDPLKRVMLVRLRWGNGWKGISRELVGGKIMLCVEGAFELVSCGCHDESPCTEWLRTTGHFLSQFWSPETLKLRLILEIKVGLVSSGGCEEDTVSGLFPSFWWLPAIFGL